MRGVISNIIKTYKKEKNKRILIIIYIILNLDKTLNKIKKKNTFIKIKEIKKKSKLKKTKTKYKFILANFKSLYKSYINIEQKYKNKNLENNIINTIK